MIVIFYILLLWSFIIELSRDVETTAAPGKPPAMFSSALMIVGAAEHERTLHDLKAQK